MSIYRFFWPCLFLLSGIGLSIGSPAKSILAERYGYLLSAERAVVVNSTTGRYLILDGLPIVPINKNLPKLVTAIIDSGIAKDHPQLAGRVIEEVDFTGEGTKDEIGHGTVITLMSLLGFMGEREKIPDVSVGEIFFISLKVVNRDQKIRKENLLAALAWIENKPIYTVNLSLGFEGTQAEFEDICQAIDRNKRAFFLAAAGNKGPDKLSYPAACKLNNLISIGLLGLDGKPHPSSGKADKYVSGTAIMVPWAQKLLDEAMAIARNGNLVEALAKLDESISDQALPEAYLQKGLIFLHQRNYSKAEGVFRKALELNRGYPEALLHLGISLYLQNDLQGAKRSMEEALDLAPHVLSIRFNLSLVLMDLKDYLGALEQLSEIKKIDPNYKNLRETENEIQRRKNAR